MKSVALCVLVIFALAAAAHACGSCPPNRNPQCGFNGVCLHVFNNPCELIRYNCQTGDRFRQTDMYQCNSASNYSNGYPKCRQSGNYLW